MQAPKNAYRQAAVVRNGVYVLAPVELLPATKGVPSNGMDVVSHDPTELGCTTLYGNAPGKARMIQKGSSEVSTSSSCSSFSRTLRSFALMWRTHPMTKIAKSENIVVASMAPPVGIMTPVYPSAPGRAPGRPHVSLCAKRGAPIWCLPRP